MINTREIVEYVKEKFNKNILELQAEESLTNKYDVTYYDKVMMEKEIEEVIENYNFEEEFKPLSIIVKEQDFEQDVSIPNNVWAFSIELSLLTKLDYVDDVFDILKEFIIKNKVIRHKFKNSETVMLNISDGWDDERLEVRGDLYYTAILTIDVVVISGMLYSNDIKVYIEGIELPNTTLSLVNETEMVQDMKKLLILGFIPNTSIYQIALVTLFDLNNAWLRTLVDHIHTSQLFNQPVEILIKAFGKEPKDNENETEEETEEEIEEEIILHKSTRKMFVKSVELQADRGSIVVLKVSFVTPTVLPSN